MVDPTKSVAGIDDGPKVSRELGAGRHGSLRGDRVCG
jgi:hypothetical protein